MEKENLILCVFFLGGLWYLNQPAKENYFFVPDVGDVPESKLPSHGYTKYNGKWFKTSDLEAAAIANGIGTGNVDISTQEGMDLFLTLLSAGAGLAIAVINNTDAQKDSLIEQILTKYTFLISPSYDDNFPFTEAQLQTFTVAKLNQILAGNFSINGISSRALTTAQCNDGKYSDSRNGGVCSHHGGVKQRASWANNL